MNEDATISHKGLRAVFLQILDSTRQQLNHYEAALLESHDFQGHPHKAWVEATAATIRKHLDSAEQEIGREA